MKRTLWVPVLLMVMLGGCANPFMKHYQDGSGGLGKQNRAEPAGAGEPKLTTGTDPDGDALRMLEDGYTRIGVSYFNAASVDAHGALEQAKAVHADSVIVYSSKAGERHNYLATYWVKLQPPVFGVHMQDLTTETRILSGTKTGAYVIAVVKDSPAARAGIVRGDIIRKIGDVDVNGGAVLYDAVMKYAGQKVMVEIWREHQAVEKEVQLDRKQ